MGVGYRSEMLSTFSRVVTSNLRGQTYAWFLVRIRYRYLGCLAGLVFAFQPAERAGRRACLGRNGDPQGPA
ncbi:hypothetical protein SBA4_5740006 [Candidatus Sulfopaludibacter sp. SbA4]|nr:hypothetical protein SBA4_5740006 [Candidatus Sulfopaludibacter sp. SbA4]